MSRHRLLTLLVASVAIAQAQCRQSYPAPPPRELPPLDPTGHERDDPGDPTAIRVAESQCLASLSPRAVASAFRAVDEVADELLDLCSIGIVNDDPLLWHLWCGSDALFDSGFYLPPEGRTVQCGRRRTDSVFECVGTILARHLLNREMREHVRGVEVVSLGSVDRQPINLAGQFVRDPCLELQDELGLPESARWGPLAEAPEEVSAEERDEWNRRLSWCRAAYSTVQLHQGIGTGSRRVQLAAVGAGTDWLDHWREAHQDEQCPTPPEVSGERLPGQCRDARRVDVFIHIQAVLGTERAGECQAPPSLREDSARALYCYAQCQSRAAVGRNPSGVRTPSSPANVLFGTTPGNVRPQGWLVSTTGASTLNMVSLRSLFLRSAGFESE